MSEEKAKALAKYILKIAKELFKEGKDVEDMQYCKSFPESVWFCEKCEALLNVQEQFEDAEGFYQCKKCGYINRLSDENVYNSPDEYEHKRKRRMS